jgi:serine/threonine protein kinase
MSDCHYFIDMKLCDLTLQHYMTNKATASEHIWNIMKDIAGGVSFLHANGLVHRDLKPSNGMSMAFLLNVVLYSRSDLSWKLTDFGLTSIKSLVDLNGMKDGRGISGYRAPDFIRDSKSSYKSDIWAMGCIMYELTFSQQQGSSEDADMNLKLLNFVYDRFSHLLKLHFLDGIPLHTHNCGLSHLRSTRTYCQVYTASPADASRNFHPFGLQKKKLG